MLDPSYFETGLPSQLKAVGQHPVVRVVLDSGQEYYVRKVDLVSPGYVLLTVYPRQVAASFESTVTNLPSHHLTLPYEVISQIAVSSATAEEHPRMGFHGQPER